MRTLIGLLALFTFIISFQNCAGQGDLTSYGSDTSSNSSNNNQNNDDDDDDDDTGNNNNPPSVLTIRDQTANVNRFVGENVTFMVDVIGSDNLQYQWYKDGAPINGAINNEYLLQNLVANDAGSYYAIISDGNGEANPVQSSNMLLTIDVQSKITAFANPAMFFNNLLYILYTSPTQGIDLKNTWQLEFCKYATANDNATVVSATEGVPGDPTMMAALYYSASGLACPFDDLGNGWCGFAIGTPTVNIIPYTEIKCQEP